jgi:hypothetical protein
MNQEDTSFQRQYYTFAFTDALANGDQALKQVSCPSLTPREPMR